MSLFQLLFRFLGFQPAISPDQREAVLAYVVKELKFHASQDSEAERYNNVLTKYGGSLPDKGLEVVLAAAKRLSKAGGELVRRHSELSPVPDEAALTYFRWHETYMAYQEWASETASALEGYAAGFTPVAERVQALFGQEQTARQRAVKELGELCKRLGLRAEDMRRLMQEADTAAKGEEWQPN